MRIVAAIAFTLVAGPGLAQGVETDLRPVARPEPAALVRPVARPLAEGDREVDDLAYAAEVALLTVTEPPALAPLEAAGAARQADAPEDAVMAAAAPLRPLARPEEEPPLRPVARPGGADLPAEEPQEAALAEAVPGSGGEAPVLVERLSTLSVVAGPAVPIPATIRRAEAAMTPPLVLLDRGARARPEERPPAGWIALPVPEGAVPGEGSHWTEAAVAESFRPPERPERIIQAAAARVTEAAPQSGPAAPSGAGLCGSERIRGEVLGVVSGAGACGVEGAVRVTSVAGVRMSSSITVDCQTARALLDWTERTALPSVGNLGGGLASLQVMGSYSCRGRNGQPGARLSEHAFGRAIDIGGFTLRNGGSFTVLNGWNSGSYAEILRAMHRGACRTFGTVLGPDANAFHRNHFHFDTARHRSGGYCR